MTVPQSVDDSPATAPILLPATDINQADVNRADFNRADFNRDDVKHAGQGAGKPDRRIPLAMIIAGVVLVVAAVLSYRHGIATNLFPAYLADGAPTPIRRYSAPWIAGAAGLVILAGFLFTHATTRLVHYKL